MSQETHRQVDELISFISCPPCPWDDREEDVSTEDISNDVISIIVARLEELSRLLKHFSSSSSGFSLSVSPSRRVAPMEGCLIEEVDETADGDEFKSLGRDVLLHVIGLYSALGGGAVARDPGVGKILAEIEELLEGHEGTCELVDRAMPDILEEVHSVVVAHVDFEDRSSTSVSLMQYKGPNEWERYLRSIELIWLLQNVSYEQMTVDERMVTCRTIALGCKDVSYRVRNVCLEAFSVLIDQFHRHSMLKEHASGLSDVLMGCMMANDERCWDGTYRAVSCMIQVLSSDKREALLERSIEQAYRNSHSLIFASAWLQAMHPCFESAGISLMQYSTMLLPTLLEWVQALHEDVQKRSLNVLYTYLRVCWPRNHAHAHSLWEILQEVYKSASPEISAKVSQVAEIIWVTSGQKFRFDTRSNHDAMDELTLTIMKKLDPQEFGT